jgi:hypothetical protein
MKDVLAPGSEETRNHAALLGDTQTRGSAWRMVKDCTNSPQKVLGLPVLQIQLLDLDGLLLNPHINSLGLGRKSFSDGDLLPFFQSRDG